MKREFIKFIFIFTIGSGLVYQSFAFDVQITTDARITSCTDGGPNVPNLSYARVYRAYTSVNYTCDSVTVGGFNETYIFYYYDPYTGNCGDIKNISGTVNYASVLSTRKLGAVIGLDIDGTFIDGPYIGQSAIATLIYPSANLLQCNSTIGMESLSGNFVLTIIGGPTCNGVTIKTFCPGLHFATEQSASVILPPLPGPLSGIGLTIAIDTALIDLNIGL